MKLFEYFEIQRLLYEIQEDVKKNKLPAIIGLALAISFLRRITK